MRIIAYTYDADAHCVECAKKRKFKFDAAHEGFRQAHRRDEHGLPEFCRDSEGNPVRPIFSTDEISTPLSCGTCWKKKKIKKAVI